MPLAATYFDGQSSRGHQVELAVENGTAFITGEIQREAPLHALRVSERIHSAPRRVTFADGATLEVADARAFAALLAATGYRDSRVVVSQQSWRATVAAVLALILLLVLGDLYALPLLARSLANRMPPRAERLIGIDALRILDGGMLAPMALDAGQQRRLTARFATLAPPLPGAPPYEIVFRKSRVGPNAFALPSGQIVLTDELVKLVGDEDALMGVLAHELGHLQSRDLLRRVIQSSIVAVTMTTLLGDVSSSIAAVPTVLLNLKYSRDAERSADDYAATMLTANRIAPGKLADAFEKLQAVSGEPSVYLSSHPLTAERIARLHRTHD